MKNKIQDLVQNSAAPEDKKLWMMKRHLEYNAREKSLYEQKIADFLEANNVEYYFKYPIWIQKEKRIFFVDFYLPHYTLMIDIETKRESPYYDERKDAVRKLVLSGINGMGYHIVKRRNLKSDDFRCKISGAMLSKMKKTKLGSTKTETNPCEIIIKTQQ